MIKCDAGKVELQGNEQLLLVDLATIVHSMLHDYLIKTKGHDPREARETILRVVDKGFKTEKELEHEAKELVLELLGKIREFLTGKDEE